MTDNKKSTNGWQAAFWVLAIVSLFALMIVGIIGYGSGFNAVAEECNLRLELDDALDDLERALCDQAVDVWHTYEVNCPEVHAGLLNNTIPIIREEVQDAKI